MGRGQTDRNNIFWRLFERKNNIFAFKNEETFRNDVTFFEMYLVFEPEKQILNIKKKITASSESPLIWSLWGQAFLITLTEW